jgi:MbtH protein
MAMPEEHDDRIYVVVMNDEEQHSVWLADRELPLGWKAVGFTGTRETCLEHVTEIWTDMRPLSLRRKLQDRPV